MWAATRIRPVLEGHVPDLIETPQPRHERDRWPERLAGRAIERIDTHGKNLFLQFEGDLVIYSHLRMTGSWRVFDAGRRWSRAQAWLVPEQGGRTVVQLGGPARGRPDPRDRRRDARPAGRRRAGDDLARGGLLGGGDRSVAARVRGVRR